MLSDCKRKSHENKKVCASSISMNRLLLILMLVASSVQAAPLTAVTADSINILFRPGSSRVERNLAGNDSVLQRFVAEIRRQSEADNIDSIVIKAYTSPDGVSTANVELSSFRGNAVADFLVSATGINPGFINVVAGGIGWDGLRRAVDNDRTLPYRKEVLRIIDNTPVWVRDSHGDITGGRKKSLMVLYGGEAYRQLRARFFNKLHYAEIVLYIKKRLTLQNDCYRLVPVTSGDIPIIPACLTEIKDKGVHPDIATSQSWRGRVALKTNLIYDIALMPSIELEFRMNRSLSFNIEGNIAWWKKKEEHKCYQLAIVSPELRYWVRRRSILRGFYTGIFIGGGIYDLENGKKGYRGEGLMAGVSVGYSWPVSRSVSIEAGLGLGCASLRNKEYVPFEGHHIYLRTSRTSYWGPLKAKLAIVWRLGTIFYKQS